MVFKGDPRRDTSATVTPESISWVDCKNISTRFHKQWLYCMSVLIRVMSVENNKKLVNLSAGNRGIYIESLALLDIIVILRIEELWVVTHNLRYQLSILFLSYF